MAERQGVESGVHAAGWSLDGFSSQRDSKQIIPNGQVLVVDIQFLTERGISQWMAKKEL